MLVPGDDQEAYKIENRATGINIDDATFEELAKLASKGLYSRLLPLVVPAAAAAARSSNNSATPNAS